MVTTDFSSMEAIELQGEISKYERAYTRVKQAVSDMVPWRYRHIRWKRLVQKKL